METTENTANQSEANQDNLADLSIKDLMALRSIIDLASQRGAFKPKEMVSIGQTYSKLDDFLEIIIAQQRAQQAGQNEENT